MKFELDFKVLIDDAPVGVAALTADLEKHREELADIPGLEGQIVPLIDGEEQDSGDIFEPLVRLASQWAGKLPWVLSGDTETLALRNSEHCYAFVPAGDSVEFSLFAGTETEIEDYVIEPVNVKLDELVEETLGLCQRLIELVRKVDEGVLDADEDCRGLVASLEEAQKSWRDYKLHQRR